MRLETPLLKKKFGPRFRKKKKQDEKRKREIVSNQGTETKTGELLEKTQEEDMPPSMKRGNRTSPQGLSGLQAPGKGLPGDKSRRERIRKKGKMGPRTKGRSIGLTGNKRDLLFRAKKGTPKERKMRNNLSKSAKQRAKTNSWDKDFWGLEDPDIN